MKFTKTEKIWLGTVVFFYLLYNLPLVPVYQSPSGTLLHAICSLIPLWICVYVGLIKVSGSYKDSKKESEAKNKEEQKC